MAINGKPKKIDYNEWSKPELIHEIKKLEKRKKYGLIWDEERTKEIFEEEIQKKLPVLNEIKSNEISTNLKQPINILIEGDNYHALSILNYTHKAKVDVIFIDPPFNTGNKTWKYNNAFVEKDDSFRHSKWLSYMKKRLKLAKNLLKDSGMIVVSIDDYEVHTLGLLMDEIFNEDNKLGTIIVESNPSGRTSDKFFATSHEYYFFYAKNPENAVVEYFDLTEEQKKGFKFKDDESEYKWRDFLRTGGYSTPEERPNSFYPIFYNPKTNKITIEKTKDLIEILPIDSNGKNRVWRQTRPSLLKLIARGDIMVKNGTNGKYKVLMKDRIKIGMKPKTVWTGSRYSASAHGTKLLEKILGSPRMFEFPKSVYAVRDVLHILTKNKHKAIVLDFFAGSGTTGHAVLDLNSEDDGARSFILCTNNENDICTEVCYPRVKRVIKGYHTNGDDSVPGLGGNLKYFKTDFVDSEPTDKNKRDLVEKATEMLCIKEDCFELIKESERFKIFKNHDDHHLGIIYYYDGIEPFKKEIIKLNKKISTYVFSLSDVVDEDDFQEINHLVNLKPIPSSILNVYRRIFAYVQTKKLPRKTHK